MIKGCRGTDRQVKMIKERVKIMKESNEIIHDRQGDEEVKKNQEV